MQTPEYETYPALVTAHIKHGFFGRNGGVSLGHLGGLNASLAVNDTPENVITNRTLAVETTGAASANLVMLTQVHSNMVVVVDKHNDFSVPQKADALVTSRNNIALGILTADCTPVLFADTVAGVIGAAHAGWKGAAANILRETVTAMEKLGAKRENITAVLGPSISEINYEVGHEFAQNFLTEYPDYSFAVNADAYPNPHLNVNAILAHQANQLGIGAYHDINICTYAQPNRYFSHRYATHHNIITGRQLSIITLTH